MNESVESHARHLYEVEGLSLRQIAEILLTKMLRLPKEFRTCSYAVFSPSE